MTNYQARRFFWVTLFALFLSACAELPPESTNTHTPWQQREAALLRVNHFNLEGKLAIQSRNDSGSATVNWSQKRDAFRLTFYGPLGVMLVAVSGRPGQTILETPEGQTFKANSPEQLLREHWGWNLPVSYLKYWVRGVPVPSLGMQTVFDSSHRLKVLKQGGWVVTYLNYTTESRMDLPTRLNISGNGLRAKLVVYDWEV